MNDADTPADHAAAVRRIRRQMIAVIVMACEEGDETDKHAAIEVGLAFDARLFVLALVGRLSRPA